MTQRCLEPHLSRLPVHLLARIQNSPFAPDYDEPRMNIVRRILGRQRTVQASENNLEPRDSKPKQRSRLKRESEGECALIGHDRIVTIHGCPLANDEANSI